MSRSLERDQLGLFVVPSIGLPLARREVRRHLGKVRRLRGFDGSGGTQKLAEMADDGLLGFSPVDVAPLITRGGTTVLVARAAVRELAGRDEARSTLAAAQEPREEGVRHPSTLGAFPFRHLWWTLRGPT